MLGPTWIYDESPTEDPGGRGQRAVDFLRLLKHPKSRAPGRAFEVFPFMERMVRRIYGPEDEHGNRQVRTVFILLPRGNRKTSLGAALALLHTFGPERINGGQVISAAADRKQARIAYEEALGIVGEIPQLAGASKAQDFKNRLVHRKSGSIYEAISADAGTQHGRTPSFVLADELHAWKKRDLFDVLRTGLVKVTNSLLVVITTAGRGQENIAHDLYSYAKKVQAGEIDDAGFLPVLFEAPASCDWRDEAIWHAVNPGLKHGFPDLGGLRQLAREAEERPADREAFRQLHLNIWIDRAAAPFVDMAVYDEGAQPVDLQELAGVPCWLGVDLSSSGDLTAIVACFRDGDDYFVHPFFFCPAETLEQRQVQAGAPYVRWAEEGLIEPTPGNVVNLDRVESVIREIAERFDVQEIAFDPALSHGMLSRLLDDGLPVVEMRQGALTMMPAIASLERAIIGRRLHHGGHDLLRWCFSNIEVQTNTLGHVVRFLKAKRWLSIDGAVATAMAVGRASAGGNAGPLDLQSITGSESGTILFV